MISNQKIREGALQLRVPIATVKAVAEVESGNSGFYKPGTRILNGSGVEMPSPEKHPVILFEGHIFWKRLRKYGILPEQVANRNNRDILFPLWDPEKHPYGKSSEQPARLDRASMIHREAALESTSWGAFQILGENWKRCKCENLQDFVNRNFRSEDDQLQLFIDYILHTGLDDELRGKDWATFAMAYNGPQYWKHNYDGLLEAAYRKHSK